MSNFLKIFVVFIIGFLPASNACSKPGVVSAINAFHRHGQTFLQWEEMELADWTTFNVYRSDNPILDIDSKEVECLARDIIPRSGRSFYVLKRQGFMRPLPCNEKRTPVVGSKNAKIDMEGLPLPDGHGKTSVTGGVFVHTARKDGQSYYAVTFTAHGKNENKVLARGENSLLDPVGEITAPPRPYEIDTRGSVPKNLNGDKLPFKIYLYAIGGTVDMSSPVQFGLEHYRTYLLWMPGEFGWREGLPTIFYVKTNSNRHGDWIELQPDDSNFAFMGFANSWWFGYNENILYPDRVKDGVVRLYSQKKLRYIINWLYENYPVLDRTDVEIFGSSMGGTGALFFGLRNPDIIGLVNANVPAGNLPELPGGRQTLADLFGPLDADIRTENGFSAWDEVNNTWYVREHDNLPFILVSNARYDTWMQWEHSVAFYRALDEEMRPFAAWWSPAGHNGSSRHIIPVFSDLPYVNVIRTDVSRPGISNFSLNQELGNGGPDDGDTYGGMNCNIVWEVLKDEESEYSIVFRPSPALGPDYWRNASFSFTPANLQKFMIRSGENIQYETMFADKQLDSGVAIADTEGRVKIPVSTEGNRGPVIVMLSRE